MSGLANDIRAGLLAPELLAFTRAVIERIEEDGEPTPGTRWHAEYVEAKRLVAAATGTPA